MYRRAWTPRSGYLAGDWELILLIVAKLSQIQLSQNLTLSQFSEKNRSLSLKNVLAVSNESDPAWWRCPIRGTCNWSAICKLLISLPDSYTKNHKLIDISARRRRVNWQKKNLTSWSPPFNITVWGPGWRRSIFMSKLTGKKALWRRKKSRSSSGSRPNIKHLIK